MSVGQEETLKLLMRPAWSILLEFKCLDGCLRSYIGLSGLRIEMEIIFQNLLRGWNIKSDKYESPTRILRKLYEVHAITSQQYELAAQVLRLCNKAVHGELVSRNDALRVLEVSVTLVEQYISWLSWGFKD